MSRKYLSSLYVRNSILVSAILLLALVLAACGNTSTSPTQSAGHKPTPPPVITASSSHGSPGTGPLVLPSSTSTTGNHANGQQTTLADRILSIESVTKQNGSSANLVDISLTITIKNTSSTAITNQTSYFQLIGKEGDIFGLPSNTTSDFFGSIAPQSSHTGTIVFELPLGAVNGLRLLYRSDKANETVFFPLNV